MESAAAVSTDADAYDENSWQAVRASLHRNLPDSHPPPGPVFPDFDSAAPFDRTDAHGGPDPDAGSDENGGPTPDGAEFVGAATDPASDSPDDSPDGDHGDDQREAAAAGGTFLRPPPRDGLTAPSHADGPHRGWWIAGRAAVALVAVLTLLTVGTYWVIKHRADAVIADRQVSAVVPDDTNIVDQDGGDGGPVSDGGSNNNVNAAAQHYQAENILLLGSDTRATEEDARLGGAGTVTMQSDVLMLLHLSADRSHVSIVSIPRDLYIKAPTCKAWDYRTNSLSDVDYDNPYSEWKITNAYSVGGPQCTVRAVQQLTGLRIDRVIIVDFAGFKTMVDALDGITVNVCRPIIDGNLGVVIPDAGVQHINGKQALKLVRAREVQGDSEADLARIRRQQKVLSTMLRQITSAGVLLDPVQLDKVLQAFVHNVQTDNVDFDDLVTIAQSLGNLDPKHVTFYTLPTVPAEGTTGLNLAPVGPLVFQALRNDEPLPGEQVGTPDSTSTTTSPTPTTSSTAPSAPPPVTRTLTEVVTSTPTVQQKVTVDPSEIDLQVVNVAGRPGVATQAMNGLTPSGFELDQPDLLLIPGDVREDMTVEYAPDNRAAAVTVAAAVPGAKLVPTEGLGSKVRLILGSDFDGTINEVAVGDDLPDRLSTEVEPVVTTHLSTVVSTPPTTSPSTSTPTTTSTPAAPTTTTPTLGTDDVQLHNAASASCI